jgi:hypothetical protein
MYLFIFSQLHAQSVGIGNSSPDASAQLDVSATNKGLLIPRMSSAAITSITNPAKGLMVYDTAKNQLMVNMGTSSVPNWQTIVFNSGWSLAGNSGINPSTQFVGTTDFKPLNFRTNNRKAGTLDDSLHNVFFGVNTGFNTAPSSAFDGRYNTFIGDSAGVLNTTGFSNTFVGRSAGYSNTTSGANSFFGYQAGQSNTTGSANALFGYNSGRINTIGAANSFYGYFSGEGNSTGSENSYFGTSAGRGDIINGSSGSRNAAFGRLAGQFITSGASNSFFGAYSGNQNNTGIENTFAGDSAGYNNTSGLQNSFFGKDAGLNSSTASANSFFGVHAGMSNTTGQPNAFFGYNSGRLNTSGSVNSFYGYFSGEGNSTGNENSYFGGSAGRGDIINGSSGSRNAAFGRMAGQFMTSANNNSFFGAFSGNQSTTGSDNTFIGDSSGYNNLSGQQNVFVGRASGLFNTTGTQNTLLGYSSSVSASSLTNATAIGSKSFVGASNSLVLGSINGVNGAVADTKVGIGTTAPANKLHIVLNDQGAAPAGLLVENIGSPGIGEATIALKNIDTGDSTWMMGLNETKHLSFAFGTQLVGGTTKMFLNTNGNIGIGTVSPSEKLDVAGNIRTSGDVLRSQTGSSNVAPICFGAVSSGGSIDSGTGNFSVTHSSGTGIYTIGITGESYSFITYNTIVTPVGLSAILTSTFSSSGNLVIRLFNTSGTLIDADFCFVVYKP